MTAERKLKVAFYDEALAMGGSLMVLSHLFKELDRSAIQPMLITAMPVRELAGLFEPEDIIWAKKPPLNYVTRTRWVAWGGNSTLLRRAAAYLHTISQTVINLAFQFELGWRLLRKRPDIIHINNGFFPFVLAWLLRVRVVFHLHGIQTHTSSLRLWFVLRSDAFIAISGMVRDSALAMGYQQDRIYLIPNPAPRVDVTESRDQIRKRFNLPGDSIVITHVGRIVRWKGQLEFLRAFARTHEEAAGNTIALIVGDSGEGFGNSYEESLRAFVEAHGLGSAVRFLGYLPSTLSLMRASDVVVHSSIEPEPFGLVITEAMAACTAVMASKMGAPAEIVSHGVDGLLFDPLCVEDFSAKLTMLVNDEHLRSRLSSAAQTKASNVFSPRVFMERVTESYDAVINKG